jgi:trichothecene 3-O-acetyltransferase
MSATAIESPSVLAVFENGETTTVQIGQPLDELLDIFGQQPMLSNAYTQVCLCYPVHQEVSRSFILDTLRKGLDNLSEHFPWVAGQVVNEAGQEGSSGTMKIRAFKGNRLLKARDLREIPSAPTMEGLRSAGFPLAMLDESVVAPRGTFTLPDSPEAAQEAPVFSVQANSIEKGLVITFVANHGAMDMSAMCAVMAMLDKACRDEAFTASELQVGNMKRTNLIPLLQEETYKENPALVHQMFKAPPVMPQDCEIGYFRFPSAKLLELKTLATPAGDGQRISTDDALSAFVWQAIMRARLPRLSTDKAVTLARAVDVRSIMGIPKEYPGLMINTAFKTYVLQKLLEEPLNRLAPKLRSQLSPETSSLEYDTRCLATLFDSTHDKRFIAFTAGLDPSVDVLLSSWAKSNNYELDFGLGLGKPEFVGRTTCSPVLEGLLHVMPRDAKGDIAVSISLRGEDMSRLQADIEMAKYASYIG